MDRHGHTPKGVLLSIVSHIFLAPDRGGLKGGLKTICSDNILIINVLFEYMVRPRQHSIEINERIC